MLSVSKASFYISTHTVLCKNVISVTKTLLVPIQFPYDIQLNYHIPFVVVTPGPDQPLEVPSSLC